MQKDAREANIVAIEEQLSTKVQVEGQQATKVQVMAKAQQRAMEMERHELEAITRKIHTMLDKVTLLNKGIKIINPEQLMWTQTKQNYDKHVERMEN